ncbi:type II restriction endonuclease [Actinomadura welshii]|uniref:type II restriction endonuclease n=1 Tax=Actinomadura welshii TaxID=3103817 RepID=UPI0003AD312F|nr:type II restriction endonuclease [Actinomadura madurae]
MVVPKDLKGWLRDQCAEYHFGLGGVFQRDSSRAQWPISASSPEELEHLLSEGGHLLPLPKESAALANVLEVSIVDFLIKRLQQLEGGTFQRGTERGYPDLEVSGPAFGDDFHAVEVKVARRSQSMSQTQSRITLYTGNTYFKWPDLHWRGTFRPFNDYGSHLDILMIYTFNPGNAARVEDLEFIVQEPWRIASRERSSTTREYIGAVKGLDDLREGRGSFDTPEAFYDYWRKYPFKLSTQVQKDLQSLLAQKDKELAQLRAAQEGGTQGP